jgi:putative endonuclease
MDRYYVGHSCEELDERTRKHNSSHKGFTGKASDWEVSWYKAFSSKELAYAVELKIKSWKSRKLILKLIEGAVSIN